MPDFNDTNISEECLRCREKVISKSKNKTFDVSCSGIFPADYKLQQQVSRPLTESERQAANSLLDPVGWANAVLGWTPRVSRDGIPYQATMLRCDAKRTVSRCGRRIGKSIRSISKLNTVDGPIKLRQLIDDKSYRPEIFTFDEKTQKVITTDDYTIFSSGTKEWYKLKTSTGRITWPADTHPFLVMRDGKQEWVKTKDLRVGEKIAVPKTYGDIFLNEEDDLELARLLGYLTGDGGTNYPSQVRMTNFDQEILDDLSNIIVNYGCELSQERDREGHFILAKIKDKFNPRVKNKVLEASRKHGLQGKKATGKVVPNIIYKGTKEFVANFIGAYWDCDGWLSASTDTASKYHPNPSTEIGICSSSEELAYGTQHLLLRLGIVSRLKEKKVKYKGEYRKAWQVTIGTVEGQNRFMELIPLKGKDRHKEKIRTINNRTAKYSINIADNIPKEIFPYIKEKQKELGLSNSQVCGYSVGERGNARLRSNISISREKLLTYADALDGDNYLETLANSDIIWDEIKELSYQGKEECFDLEVLPTHTIIADDIISHNSDVMAIDMLYNASTKSDEKILVVCPQKSHAQVVYDRLTELIEKSGDLKNSLRRSVKTPYAEIEFHNGSMIKLFTSGSKSGSEGQSIRGQTADKIYLDEADYLEDADHNAIGAILYSSPDTTLWSSSTPTGKRQRFYEQCHDARFREFHYPSHVLPFWNDQMEKDARLDSGTEAGYSHEILSEFGEEQEGVYQNQYVDRAIIEYKYEDQKREDGWIYCMGVDWNDTKIGTQIVVVGFNPASNKYRIVGKHCVDKVGWTQLAAIDKIKEVNEYWRCDHIYCDAGFGTTQIELLQQFGERRLSEVGATHPDAMLRYVKGINAGGILETKNIRTGITENKPAKPYMIENSVRYFEHDIMEMSKHDEELEAEVLGYVVERRTQAGAPVYAQGNKRVGDHVLDAMVLALLAFTMEFTEFGQILTRSCVSFGGSFGERKASRGAPTPGTVELVIESTYKRREEKNKRDASMPQDRFDTGESNMLSRGTPGMIQSYNSITGNNKAVRTGMKKLKQTRPTRSNI